MIATPNDQKVGKRQALNPEKYGNVFIGYLGNSVEETE